MPDAVENQAVVSDIPALILSGEYDPVTPPAGGDIVAGSLSRATHFEFPGVGHGVVGNAPCANRLAVGFLSDPTAVPDGSCVGQ
jgi:pimeloyl-ACP methyl ester carboxylesterase